jgi:trimeric autotransporter adhesin
VNFGIVDENSISSPFTLYFSNTTAGSVQITAITIAGANNADFAFYGGNCVGTIVSGGTCQAALTFTPSAIGARNATLKISVAGATNTINVPLMGTGGNPLPNITSISPPSLYAGSPATKVTLNGTGVLPSSAAYWDNAQPLTTTYVGPSQLTVVLPASDLTEPGSSFIYVTNPAPGGGNGAEVSLQIIGLDPSANSVSPSSLVSGTPTNPVVISGSSFMTGATVLWNGKPLPTTYLNSGQLQAQVSTSQLAKASIAQLSVSNPAPGGVSNAIPFDVTYPSKVFTLDLPANDVVWDPYARRIYASLPSSYGVNGNSIAVVNPFTGAVSAYHFAGSEPNQLALSADGQYLYVGLNGSDSVQRFILPAFTPDINVSLDTGSQAYVAGTVAVSPTDSHMFAVTLSSGCCSTPVGLLELFEDAKPLASQIGNLQFEGIVFPTATTLYGYYNGELTEVTISSTGGKLGKQWSGLVEGSDIQYAAGLIYGNAGQVFNPSTGSLLGTFDVGNPGCCNGNQLLPDAPINRAFAVGITPFFGSFGITS